MLFAMIFAGPTMTGPIASGYTSGLECIWAIWGMAIGCFWYASGGLKDMYRVSGRHGVLSVPGVFRYRFDTKVEQVMMVFMVIVFTMFFTLQISAVGVLFSGLIDSSYIAMALIATVAYVLMAWFGFKGVAWQNFVHNIMMVLGFLVLVVLSVSAAGGLPNMFKELPYQPYWNLFYPSVNVGAADALSSIFQTFVSGTIVTCCFCAKDRISARLGFIIGGVLSLVYGTFGPLSGMASKIFLGEGQDPNQVLNIIVDKFGPVCSVLVTIAILAATASTAPGLMMVVVNCIVNNFYPAVRKDAGDKEKMMLTRILLFVVAGIAFVLSFTFANNMVGYLFYAFYLNAVAGVVLWISCFWGKVNARSAIWSMSLGGITCFVWRIAGDPAGISSFWAAMVMTFVVLFALSALNKEEDPNYISFRKELEYLKANPEAEYKEYLASLEQ